jgi:hypothetical protein
MPDSFVQSESPVKCALLATLVATRLESPIATETLLTLSAVESHEYVEAREELADLGEQGLVTDHGFRGVELNDDAVGALAQLLATECDWDPFAVESRLEHYDG